MNGKWDMYKAQLFNLRISVSFSFLFCPKIKNHSLLPTLLVLDQSLFPSPLYPSHRIQSRDKPVRIEIIGINGKWATNKKKKKWQCGSFSALCNVPYTTYMYIALYVYLHSIHSICMASMTAVRLDARTKRKEREKEIKKMSVDRVSTMAPIRGQTGAGQGSVEMTR